MATLVPAATRTLTLFEVFAREKRPLSNSELARLLDLPESSCSDLVKTLLTCGYLMKTAKSRRLYPTGRLLTVAQDISANDSVLTSVREACDLLRDKTGESVLCGRLEEGTVRVMAMSEGRHSLRYAAGSGDRLSLHVSALGKAILALGSDEEAIHQLQIKPLRKLASGTLTDLDRLLAQIQTFRQQGWASVENEGVEDLAALAVAGTIGSEAFAISIAGPVGRLRMHQDDYVRDLIAVGEQLFD
ncbi:IclR family transcriptional regulator [Hydrogenophaga sp.]|uniref:IclR family transcriptional regulator n=1 Tax=Hydrogenophaga sp. TaxID=1904254 RepID=UPI00391D45B6